MMKPIKIILKENATDPDMVEFITKLPTGKIVMWGTICNDMLGMGWRERLSKHGEVNCEIRLEG